MNRDMSVANKISKISLIVEKADGELWGRVRVKGNLIVDSAASLAALKKQLKKLILDFEEVEVEDFEISYDLTSFFEQYPYINISEVAAKAGIDYAMMRQYSSGKKYPSEVRIKKIEQAIHEIGKELSKVKLHKPVKEYA